MYSCRLIHCVKSVHIRSFSGPYFSVFNSVSLRLQSEYRKMRTRKTPYLDTFHAVIMYIDSLLIQQLNLHSSALWRSCPQFFFSQFNHSISIKHLGQTVLSIVTSIAKSTVWLIPAMHEPCNHGTMMRTVTSCKKIPCY